MTAPAATTEDGATAATEDEAPPPPAPPLPPREPPPSEPRPSGEDIDVVQVLPRVLKIVGSVVAPTTLLTALLFYFGRLHVQGMFRYLRVNFTVLDFSVQDYLVRSADGLFVPIAVAAGSTLLLLWTHGVVVRALPEVTRQAAVQRGVPLIVLVGLVLLAVAMAGLGGSSTFASTPEVPGLCLAIAVVLLAFSVRLRQGAPPRAGVAVAEWGAVFVVVAVGLFWAVGSYALGVGSRRAQQIEQQLASMADVIVYSEQSLSISEPTVRKVTCADAEAAYRYRYDGLKLLLQSGDQYLLLPEGWTRNAGTAILVPRSDALRLEFTSPGGALGGTC